MRYLETFELFEGYKNKEVCSIIMEDCKPFIEALRKANMKDVLLYHGVLEIKSEIIKLKPFKKREPKDTPLVIQKKVDAILFKKFGWRPRKSGVFTTTSDWQAGEYGDLFLFFPIGEFEYVYNPNIEDMYGFLSYDTEPTIIENGKLCDVDFDGNAITTKDINKVIEELTKNYQNDNFKEALESRAEIMFKCDSYYLVNSSYEDKLKELIYE